MSDIALQNAIAKRDDLARRIATAEEAREKLRLEIAEASAAIDAVTTFIAQWYEMAGIEPPQGQAEAAVPDTSKVSKAPKPKNPDRLFVTAMAADLIRQHGKPMGRAELFRALAEHGVEIHGKDPQMVLSTMLWRTPEVITRIEGYGYWPTGTPYEAAGYLAESGQTALAIS